jgi:predicted nucleotide-binding protein
VPDSDGGTEVTFRRLTGDRAAMSGADASDIVVRHPPARRSQRIFITRTNGGKVSEHVKELVASGQFEPVVARHRGPAGGPLLYDLIEQMRGCDTAVIHVTAGPGPGDAERPPRISDDVLIEIGAAMALYGREFVLLVEDAVQLPPCLRGLRECRYTGNELNMPPMMRLLRAFGSFTHLPSEGPPAASDVRCEAAAKH